MPDEIMTPDEMEPTMTLEEAAAEIRATENE